MIYYFSGTGNTKYIALQLADALGMKAYRFSAEDLRHPERVKLTSADELIIWAFPTYSWGVPPVISEILRKAEFDFPDRALNIAVTTCGDDTGNLAKMFRKLIAARKMRGGAVFSVQMPNTYVMMKGFDVDSPSLSQEKIEHSKDRIEKIVSAIKNNFTSAGDDLTVRGKFPAIKTSLIYPWFVRNEMSPKGFNVDRTLCVHCGRCRSVCPMANIEYDTDSLPAWGNHCAFCTACYHVCPVHAINWKKTTLRKGQYNTFL